MCNKLKLDPRRMWTVDRGASFITYTHAGKKTWWAWPPSWPHRPLSEQLQRHGWSGLGNSLQNPNNYQRSAPTPLNDVK